MSEFEKKRTIDIVDEDGLDSELYVISQTMIGGINYFLVSEEEVTEEMKEDDEEVIDVFVIKEVPDSADEETIAYEVVEDETELSIVTKVFEEMLDYVDFEIED